MSPSVEFTEMTAYVCESVTHQHNVLPRQMLYKLVSVVETAVK